MKLIKRVKATAGDTRPPELASLSGVRALAAYAVIATHAAFQSGKSLDGGRSVPCAAELRRHVVLPALRVPAVPAVHDRHVSAVTVANRPVLVAARAADS